MMTRQEMIDEAVRRALKRRKLNGRLWWYLPHAEWVAQVLRPIVIEEFNILAWAYHG